MKIAIKPFERLHPDSLKLVRRVLGRKGNFYAVIKPEVGTYIPLELAEDISNGCYSTTEEGVNCMGIRDRLEFINLISGDYNLDGTGKLRVSQRCPVDCEQYQ